MKFPEKLAQKIAQRVQKNALRTLQSHNNGIDFATNDYLGLCQSSLLFDQVHTFLISQNIKKNGATGSRLLTGNSPLYEATEQFIAQFHQAEAALIFNSGYDANVGFFSSVPQKGDVILFDEFIHASIRDGIAISFAKSYKFKHNDCDDLERLLLQNQNTTVYVVTESVFSMDGDTPNLENMAAIVAKHKAYFVIDEAHALGVFGTKGVGLVQNLGLEHTVFARIMTFGKGLGCHGAAILGSHQLKQYLVNFARSLIYTTGLSPHAVATILMAYQYLDKQPNELALLRQNILYFNQQKQQTGLKPMFIYSKSAIHSIVIPGNDKVRNIATNLQNKGFNIKAILSPTVPEGQERLRFCIHAYNTFDDIDAVLHTLSQCIF